MRVLPPLGRYAITRMDGSKWGFVDDEGGYHESFDLTDLFAEATTREMQYSTIEDDADNEQVKRLLLAICFPLKLKRFEIEQEIDREDDD